MATEKQAKMLYARATAAGLKPDYGAYLKLENGQVDAELQRIEQHERTSTAPQTPKAEPVEQKVNHGRLGMVQKLVLQEHSIGWAIQEPKKFAAVVGAMYAVLEQSERLLQFTAVPDHEPQSDFDPGAI